LATLLPLSAGKMLLTVMPERSVAIKINVCSLESRRLVALPPHLRGWRSGAAVPGSPTSARFQARNPLRLSRTSVSSVLNSRHERFKTLLRRHRGVATKYLASGLKWFHLATIRRPAIVGDEMAGKVAGLLPVKRRRTSTRDHRRAHRAPHRPKPCFTHRRSKGRAMYRNAFLKKAC